MVFSFLSISASHSFTQLSVSIFLHIVPNSVYLCNLICNFLIIRISNTPTIVIVSYGLCLYLNAYLCVCISVSCCFSVFYMRLYLCKNYKLCVVVVVFILPTLHLHKLNISQSDEWKKKDFYHGKRENELIFLFSIMRFHESEKIQH